MSLSARAVWLLVGFAALALADVAIGSFGRTDQPGGSGIVALTWPPVAFPTPEPPPDLDGMRIAIARLGISLPLVRGNVQRDVIEQRTPEGVALLYPSTRVPGTGGNSFVYSHARDGMFLSLWQARIGDEVTVTTADGTELRYEVTDVLNDVDPTDASWLDPSGRERLTLQTSTGPTDDYPRFIVVAVRVDHTGD